MGTARCARGSPAWFREGIACLGGEKWVTNCPSLDVLPPDNGPHFNLSGRRHLGVGGPRMFVCYLSFDSKFHSDHWVASPRARRTAGRGQTPRPDRFPRSSATAPAPAARAATRSNNAWRVGSLKPQSGEPDGRKTTVRRADPAPLADQCRVAVAGGGAGSGEPHSSLGWTGRSRCARRGRAANQFDRWRRRARLAPRVMMDYDGDAFPARKASRRRAVATRCRGGSTASWT